MPYLFFLKLEGSMKRLKLNTVYYFSWGGITLTSDNPSIEINEKDIIKFDKFIKNNYLKVVGEEDEKTTILESQIVEIEESIERDIPDVSENITVKIERIPLLSLEELEGKSKKELIKMVKDNGLILPKNTNIKNLSKLIFDNQ